MKSLSLQDPVVVDTSIGPVSAELVTFYPDGSLRRVFPLNGKLSGYWTEQNEYQLAETLTIPSSVGTLELKPINIQFYESGELKSLTLWPQERVEISTVHGSWTIKSGISFYKDGTLETCEPEKPVSINTALGQIQAFDPDPAGISGASNSLSFAENGEVLYCSTVGQSVTAVDSLGIEYRFEPRVVRSYCNDNEFFVQPLKIEFHKDMTVFKNGFTTSGKLASSSFYSLEAFRTKKELAVPMTCS